MGNINSNGQNYFMCKGERCVFNSVDFHITCQEGLVWITWPWSGDVLLKKDESMYINARGRTCITSMSESRIIIQADKSFRSERTRTGKQE